MANNIADYFTQDRGAPELDADMLPDDIIDILERLKFNFDNELHPIKIDKGVRDYLVSAVRERR